MSTTASPDADYVSKVVAWVLERGSATRCTSTLIRNGEHMSSALDEHLATSPYRIHVEKQCRWAAARAEWSGQTCWEPADWMKLMARHGSSLWAWCA